jgi:hypothetical protein
MQQQESAWRRERQESMAMKQPAGTAHQKQDFKDIEDIVEAQQQETLVGLNKQEITAMHQPAGKAQQTHQARFQRH